MYEIAKTKLKTIRCLFSINNNMIKKIIKMLKKN